ncbi:MAG: hypothetical protein PHR36_01480 [Patescibacteria group bacterium]|nr:hypothetical protein [Patescibacteria group bacterium]
MALVAYELINPAMTGEDIARLLSSSLGITVTYDPEDGFFECIGNYSQETTLGYLNDKYVCFFNSDAGEAMKGYTVRN